MMPRFEGTSTKAKGDDVASSDVSPSFFSRLQCEFMQFMQLVGRTQAAFVLA